MNREAVANELLRIAEDLVAMDFPTQDAMDKYLKDHPDADKSKHHVKETKKEAPKQAPAKEHKSAQFERFEVHLSQEDAESISKGGQDAMPAVKKLLKNPEIKKQMDSLSADDIREELSEYGAWDDDELKDNEANKQRILWIAGGHIVEGRD